MLSYHMRRKHATGVLLDISLVLSYFPSKFERSILVADELPSCSLNFHTTRIRHVDGFLILDYLMKKRDWLRLPVVSAGAEYLVMGNLMRRNILTYKAPPNHEGYDLICIHPDPRHRLKVGELAQVRIQVKSRYATDCDRGFPVKEASFGAFDFLVVVFLNIGKFYGKNDGSQGIREPEFYTLPNSFIREHHNASSSWQKVRLKNLESQIACFKGEVGFEQIATALGIPRPSKQK